MLIDTAYACLLYSASITLVLFGVACFMSFISSWISDRKMDKRMDE